MMMDATDNPLTDYENKPFVPVNPQEGQCGPQLSICFGWQELIYLQTERVVNCTAPDGTFVTSPVNYGLIAIPTTKEVFIVNVPDGKFAVVHLNWPICGQKPGFYVKRTFQSHDYGAACASSDESYQVPLCSCLPVLPPGNYEIGLFPSDVDTLKLCRAEGDGSTVNTVKKWENQIVSTRCCLEFVGRDYVLGRSTWF